MKRPADVAEAYEHGVKLAPKNANLWVGLGLAYRDLNRSENAIYALKRATEIDPKDSRSWNTLGYFYLDGNRSTDARAAFERSTKIAPKDEVAWEGLGFACNRLGMKQDASLAFKQLRDIQIERSELVTDPDGKLRPAPGYEWENSNDPNDVRVIKCREPQQTPTPVYSTPRPTYPTPSTGYSGTTRTYSVPHSKDTELDSDLQALNAAKAQAKSYSTQLDSLAREIERDRIYLNRNSQPEVDAFNLKVNRYNLLLEQQKARNRTVNQMVDDYNARLQLYGR